MDILYTVKPTADGGYIVGGESTSAIGGDKTQPSKSSLYPDYWVVKLNTSGAKVWDKTFGANDYEGLRSIVQTPDGGYIVGGWSYSGLNGDKTQASKGEEDVWLVKIDASGNKLWDKVLGGSSFDRCYSITKTYDGNYVMGGYSRSPISGDKSQANPGFRNYWILKFDGSGNKIWDKSIGGNQDDYLMELHETPDRGFILGGYSNSGIAGNKTQNTRGGNDFWIVKLNAACSVITAALGTSCSGGNSKIDVNITGVQGNTTGNLPWTLNYTVNGTSQTATSNTSTFTLQQNPVSGAVYSLVSIATGTCTTNLTNSLTIPAPISQPVISLLAPDTLISSVTGNSYEWKLNGTVLPTTTRKLKATSSGVYAVRVKTSNNCTSVFSPDYNYTISGIQEALETGVELYPNPATGSFNIFLKDQQVTEVMVFNSIGQFVLRKPVAKADNNEAVKLNLSNVAKGIYMVQVRTEEQVIIKKIVVE